ncbi:MAG: response regulator transcription factor [Candidatus Moranbacteria bacterium]|nr:response regulator transcription factor [Candidatus Moranbacteria bacterium]
MKILVIEDNEKLAKGLKSGLESEGFAVDALFDGESGQSRLENCAKDYDLVVLDIMLPKVSGLDVCRNIRAKNINLPILMLTAKDTTDDKISGLDFGADDYMIKPFSFDELAARIRALLRRPPTTIPSELDRHGINLSSATRKVTYCGEEIQLTLKEYGLLEFFMRHPGQVLSREQILGSLWDFAFDSFSNVVDVHVKNLRNKFKKNDGKKLFETIHGVGYRFKE